MATNRYEIEGDDSGTNSKTGSETEDEGSRKMSSLKRGREKDEEKCSSPNSKEESKKSKKMGFHWSWSDECVILKNFYEFAGKNGSYSKDFYHFVKNKLSVEVSNSQLSDKVYRLRKRFLKDECKGKRRMKISKGNQLEKLYEMSNNIWGSNSNTQNTQSGGNQWKAEAVNRLCEEMFERVIENVKVDISCIPPNVLEDIRKDWEQMKMAQDEYELKNANLLLQISHIRCTQNNM